MQPLALAAADPVLTWAIAIDAGFLAAVGMMAAIARRLGPDRGWEGPARDPSPPPRPPAGHADRPPSRLPADRRPAPESLEPVGSGRC